MNSSGTVANGIGRPVRSREDFRLLTGSGSFADDAHLPGLAHAVIVRSPHAHAHIASVDTEAALGSPGALAVLSPSGSVCRSRPSCMSPMTPPGLPRAAVRIPAAR
jgi:carbon-monoxide dehydrogenase large subunit